MGDFTVNVRQKPMDFNRWQLGLLLHSSIMLHGAQWVGSGRVTLRHVSPIPPLDPCVRLLPHTAHEIGTFTVTAISPGFHQTFMVYSFARSLGTFVSFPYPIPKGLRHVRGFPALRLLCPI